MPKKHTDTVYATPCPLSISNVNNLYFIWPVWVYFSFYFAFSIRCSSSITFTFIWTRQESTHILTLYIQFSISVWYWMREFVFYESMALTLGSKNNMMKKRNKVNGIYGRKELRVEEKLREKKKLFVWKHKLLVARKMKREQMKKVKKNWK